MSLHDLQVKYFDDNFHEHIEMFTPNDRLIMGKHFVFTKQKDKYIKLLEHSHVTESQLKKLDPETDSPQLLSFKEKSVSMNLKDTRDSIEKLEIPDTYFSSIKNVNERNSAQKRLNDYRKIIIDSVQHKMNTSQKTKEKQESNLQIIDSQQDVKDNTKKQNVIIRLTPEDTIVDEYVRTNCRSYTQLSSQSAQQTIMKLKTAFVSYFELQKLGLKARLPKYTKRNELRNIIFQKDSFLVQDKKIRLSLGKTMKKILIDKKREPYLYIPKYHHSSHKICMIELVPKHKGRWFAVNYVIEKEIDLPETNTYNIEDMASIDLGEVNLATIYCANKNVRPFIINGKEIKTINNKTKYSVAQLQTNKKQINQQKYNDHYYKLWKTREHKVMNFIHIASRQVINHCLENKIKKLIIGYNIGWKNKTNMGKRNNGKFYQIPYRRFVDMIFYKGEEHGIVVVENEEAYTSKCDALIGETVGFHTSYTGKRIQRGLFHSGVGFSINADVNGALNIMRKHVHRHHPELVNSLQATVGSMYQKLKSPYKQAIIKHRTSSTGRKNTLRGSDGVVLRGCDYPLEENKLFTNQSHVYGTGSLLIQKEAPCFSRG